MSVSAGHIGTCGASATRAPCLPRPAKVIIPLCLTEWGVKSMFFIYPPRPAHRPGGRGPYN